MRQINDENVTKYREKDLPLTFTHKIKTESKKHVERERVWERVEGLKGELDVATMQRGEEEGEGGRKEGRMYILEGRAVGVGWRGVKIFMGGLKG